MTKNIKKEEFATYYNKLTLNEMASFYKTNRTKIYLIAKSFGLSKSKYKPSINEKLTDEEFIKYYNRLTTQEMAAIFGVSRRGIWRKAKQLGLSKR